MTACGISVIGLGFVGLPLALANARAGFDTIGVDANDEKIASLKASVPDFFEPGIDAMLRECVRKKKIRFTADFDDAVQNSDVTFLAVGTPPKDGGIDLSHVKSAVRQIVLSLSSKKTFHLLAIKSTVPPLTTQNVIMPPLKELIAAGRADVVVNPEFLREGSAISDIQKPHITVIGSDGGRGAAAMERYYGDFYGAPLHIMHTNIPTAEMIKYANNAFLATKVSFINFMGALCESIPGADVDAVARAIGRDPRIGPLFLRAGPGFGGSCLPKDLAGMIKLSRDVGKSPDLLRAVREVNERRPHAIINMAEGQNALARGNTVSILGLAFKANTDDVREAASVKIVKMLLKRGLYVKVHDPVALENFESIFGAEISYHTDITECLKDSDCCIIMTDWDAYGSLTPRDFETNMRAPNVVDARRVLDAAKFQGASFRAVGLGRRMP